ncbi:hypothetical protein AC249_AIPGENE4496 [Exaiptasia diaphana]|nr:hypothetical protein AC249_AIPGENE4496 [Exaiptasia diaphana]
MASSSTNTNADCHTEKPAFMMVSTCGHRFCEPCSQKVFDRDTCPLCQLMLWFLASWTGVHLMKPSWLRAGTCFRSRLRRAKSKYPSTWHVNRNQPFLRVEDNLQIQKKYHEN